MRLITNISSGLDEYLCNNETIILETAKQLEDKSMQPIVASLNIIDTNIN